MTWLAESFSPSAAQYVLDDEQPGAELAPGVIIERRSLLWLPAVAALGALVRPFRAFGSDSSGRLSRGTLSWEEFLKESLPLARDLVGDESPAGQDVYLLRLAALAVRLQSAPNSRLLPFGGLDPQVEFGPSFRGKPFAIIQWRMYPRAILPGHCHPGSSVCTLGLEGEAQIRHFEVTGNAPSFDSGSRRPFHIRETRSQLIGPKRISTLSSSRDNIHYFEAGSAGARGIDITTTYTGNGNFSFIAFEPHKPVDREQGIFEAAWTGQRPK
jgi:hypothetical protein